MLMVTTGVEPWGTQSEKSSRLIINAEKKKLHSKKWSEYGKSPANKNE